MEAVGALASGVQSPFWRFLPVAGQRSGLGSNFLKRTTGISGGPACQVSSKSAKPFPLQAKQKILQKNIDIYIRTELLRTNR